MMFLVGSELININLKVFHNYLSATDILGLPEPEHHDASHFIHLSLPDVAQKASKQLNIYATHRSLFY